MEKKLLFIYNPRSGKAQIKYKLNDILETFVRAGYEVTVYPTLKTGDAGELVKNRDQDYELIVCSGGDGTLDEVVTGMMQSGRRTPIGYIPAGSTNDFAGSLGLPKNMLRAAQVAIEGKDFPCDVGSFNDDIFVYIAAFGIFTDVSYETDQEMKNILGHMAYILEGMKRLPSVRSYPMKVSYKGCTIVDDFIFGMVTNSRSVGGFKDITGKNVKMDDGVFEVTLIRKPKSPIELNAIIFALLGKTIDPATMYFFRTEEVTFEAPEESVAWTLDGEDGGRHVKVTINNICKGIDIRVRM